MKANFDSRLKALEEETAKHGNLNVCLATKKTELHLGCFLLVKSVILTSKFKYLVRFIQIAPCQIPALARELLPRSFRSCIPSSPADAG